MVGPEFDSRSEENSSFFSTSRPPHGLTKPPLQWQPGSFSGVKRLERDTHTPPSSTAVKNERRYTSTPPVCLSGEERVSSRRPLIAEATFPSQANSVSICRGQSRSGTLWCLCFLSVSWAAQLLSSVSVDAGFLRGKAVVLEDTTKWKPSIFLFLNFLLCVI